ncbi:UNVERIFIED_CONTAM: hypothetical protein FKN15_042834 [Acipenser sinensis]
MSSSRTGQTKPGGGNPPPQFSHSGQLTRGQIPSAQDEIVNVIKSRAVVMLYAAERKTSFKILQQAFWRRFLEDVPEFQIFAITRSSLQRGRLMPTATMNQTEETYSGDSYWYHEDILNVTVSNSTSVFQSPLSPLVDKAISCITIIILFITMVSLGCTMEISKIKAHILKPKGVAIAVVAQYGIMPLTAFTLAKVFQLGSIESVTVLICGCCPGGNLSNIFALALKGDMNLR